MLLRRRLFGSGLLCVQMELRSQDQALIRQLMELHSGIQELKQELSEEEQDEESDEEEGSCWDSESEDGSSSSCFYSGGLKIPRLYRRSSVP